MLRKKRGIAIIEFMFFFFVFIFFFALMYGSWGITHSAILRSIGARTYAWDSIRGRSNLAFLRDYKDNDQILLNNYWKKNSRVFTSIVDNPGDEFLAKKLKIDMGGDDWDDVKKDGGFIGIKINRLDRRAGYSNDLSTFMDPGDRLALGERNKRESSDYRTGVVHLRMAYGICLNSDCDM